MHLPYTGHAAILSSSFGIRLSGLIDLIAERGDHDPDRVALIVTEPLTTNETWQAFEANELKVFVDGAPLPSA